MNIDVGASRADGSRVSFVAHVGNLGRRWGLALILRLLGGRRSRGSRRRGGERVLL